MKHLKQIEDLAAQLDEFAPRMEMRPHGVAVRKAAATLRILVRQLGRVLAERELMDVLADAQALVEAEGEPPLCPKCQNAYIFTMYHGGVRYCPACGVLDACLP